MPSSKIFSESFRGRSPFSNSLTIVYALCIANSGNAKNIFVTGLDGYPVDDPRRYEMDEMIRK